MTKSTNKPTTAFWVISSVALLWNIMGVLSYLGQAFMTDDILATLSEGEQAYHNNAPAWVTAAFAIAVFGGTLGCVALLIRRKWATSLLLLSLITVLVQFSYNFFIQDYIELTGTQMYMPIVVLAIAVFLVWYSRKSTAKGWIS